MATRYSKWINYPGLHSGVVDDEPSIVINGETREILIPAGFTTTVAIEYDCNSNIVSFECPRIIEGHDVSACSYAFIKWENFGAKTSDIYNIKDVTVKNENLITFSWPIGPEVTTGAGKLAIQVCFLDFNEDKSQVVYRWNSKKSERLSIGPGVYNPNVDHYSPTGEGGLYTVSQEELSTMLKEVYGSE